MNHPHRAELDRQANEYVQSWAKDKPHFETVRNLMAYLAHAELTGKHHGKDTATGFIKGHGPHDWDLDALYEAAIHAHPKIRKKILAKYQKNAGSEEPESVRETLERTVKSREPTEKPRSESVRQSIDRARRDVGRPK
jgi:hypothetical protein